MFGIHHFWLFLASAIALNLTPGQDTFYILGRTLAQGRSAGIASTFGIATGSIVHTFAAAAGISAILAASASAFMLVKLAGAAYLVFLGLRLLLRRESRDGSAVRETFKGANLSAVFRQGLLTNVLNPKVALFFLAFMPQFIAANSPHKFAAFIFLGWSFVCTGTVWCLCLTAFASRLSSRLRNTPRLTDILNRAAGAIFVALGLRLATTK